MSLRAAAAVLFLTTAAAHADPVSLACRGQILLPDNSVDADAALSLTVDLRAGKVTVQGYQPADVVPPPGTQTNEVEFVGATARGPFHGQIDRVTGATTINFNARSAHGQFFSGNCWPTAKLF